MGWFNKKELKRIAELEQIIKEKEEKEAQIKEYLDKNGITDVLSAEKKLSEINSNIEKAQNDENYLKQKLEELTPIVQAKVEEFQQINENIEKSQKTFENLKSAISYLRKYRNDIVKAMKIYHETEDIEALSDIDWHKYDDLLPSVELKMNAMDVADLRKAFKQNDKMIEELMKSYEARYTTKSNQTIYKLMVIGLRAELQNALVNLKYDQEKKALANIQEICDKYRTIASYGNQSIAKTIAKFIAELQVRFNEAVHIEYEYYVKRERERAEQAAIREQMRQEAEERKELERQKKMVEKEETKYINEIDNVRAQMASESDQSAIDKLNQKIKELQEKLSKVAEKKEEIVNRQNGKAGNVYVISNLGSFGENVFKVGMTRRLEPMDRVHELGSASVPFEFDVHAMIFSEDAVSLESKLHKILDKYRVNKVNLRKEFFRISLDEIEKIVLQEDPAAAFNRTMIAEQYRQSLSMEEEGESY